MAQTIQGGGQMAFGQATEPYRLPISVPLTPGAHYYLANHPPGSVALDGAQGDPMWFIVKTDSATRVEFTTNGGSASPTWTTFLAASSIGKFYSDGQNWRVTGIGENGGGTAIVYPLDII
jgi:hypothetical protein